MLWKKEVLEIDDEKRSELREKLAELQKVQCLPLSFLGSCVFMAIQGRKSPYRYSNLSALILFPLSAKVALSTSRAVPEFCEYSSSHSVESKTATQTSCF